VGGAARPVFGPVGCCGGLVLLGLLAGFGGVVSSRPSWCVFQVIRVVFCCLQVFAEFAADWGAWFLVLSFVFFGAMCSFWGLVGASLVPSMGLGASSFVVFCGCVAWRLFLYILDSFLLYIYIYIYICHSAAIR